MVVEGAENERCFFAGLAGQGGGACKDEVISAAHAPNRGLGARGEPVAVLPSFALELEASCLSLTETRGLVFSKILPSRATYSKILLSLSSVPLENYRTE